MSLIKCRFDISTNSLISAEKITLIAFLPPLTNFNAVNVAHKRLHRYFPYLNISKIMYTTQLKKNKIMITDNPKKYTNFH